MTQSHTALMQNIRRAANALGGMDTNGFADGSPGREEAEALLLLCSACLANITSALANGIGEGESITIQRYGQTEPQTLTLNELQEWCRRVQTSASESVYRCRIQQALRQACAWVSDLREPGRLSEEQAVFAAETGHILLQVLQDAQAVGVSEHLTVALNDTLISLPEVRQLGLWIAAGGTAHIRE